MLLKHSLQAIRPILIGIMMLGAAAALLVAAQRWSVEKSNRTVEMTVEWTELRQLSAVFRVPVQQMLQEFHDAGISSIALQEQSVRQLVEDGKVFRPDPFADPRVRDLIGVSGETDAPRTVLGFPDPMLERRVETDLAERWGRDRVHHATLGAMPALIVDGGYAQFRDLGVGLDPDSLAQVKAARLGVVGRVRNYSGLNPDQLLWTVKNLRANGVHAVIWFGDDVLGNPDQIGLAAADLKLAKIAYGDVEFGKQHGAEKLSKALGGHFIRVHTIQGAELSNMTPDAAIARFVKAAKERSLRLIYIHVRSSVTGTSFEADKAFVAAIARGIRNAGYQTGIAAPMPEWRASILATSLVALGLMAALGLMLLEISGSIPVWAMAGMGALFVALLIGQAKEISILQQGGALLSAIVFPMLSLTLAHFQTERANPDSLHPDRRSREGHSTAALLALWKFVATSLFSLLGALYIIAFLSTTLFMSKTEQFLGIKPAIVIPVLAVFVIYWGRLLDPGSIADRWGRLREKIESILQEPLQLWHVVAFIIAMVLLLVLVARSGNDSAVGASAFELKTRRIMDGWLVARPRTKEFLLGNPALYLAFYAAERGWRRPVFILLVLGSIGQTSLVNTFCHIHTPLYISIFHSWNGLWLGALIGWALACLWDRNIGHAAGNRRTVSVNGSG